jgi:hypothetical protein
MSDKSAIEWNPILFPSRPSVVSNVVAVLTERNSIRQIVPTFRMRGPGLKVMGIESTPIFETAVLAGEVVALIDQVSPLDIGRRKPSVGALVSSPVDEPGVIVAARRSFPSFLANELTLLGGTWFPSAALISFSGLAHSLSSFRGVAPPLERWRRRALRVGDARAKEAACRSAVTPGPVDSESLSRLPFAAPMTPLEPGFEVCQVDRQRQANSLRCNLENAFSASQPCTSPFDYTRRRPCLTELQ